MITSCSCSQTGKDRNRQSTDGGENDPTDPADLDGGDGEQEKEKLVTDLSEDEYINFPTYYLKKVGSFKSFKSETHGATKATVSILGIPIETEQSIDVEVIKGDYSYLKNESHSSLVNTVHTAYFHNDEVISNNGNGYSKNTLNEYLNTYGTYPFDNAIEGYTVSEGSITSITKVDSENEENHSFKIAFDVDKSTNNVKIQMREFGGLDDYPSFSKIELVVTVKNDFTPVEINLESDYVAKMGMDSSCHQSYKVTFSSFDEELECPGLDEIIEQFSK